MSDRTIITTIITVVVALFALFGLAIWLQHGENARRCATIGAELLSNGRGSVCAKPDGSLWRMP